MRKLYEQAQKVYVWLGEPENTLQNELAEQKMNGFSKMLQRSSMKNHPYRPWWMPKEAPRWQNDIYRGQLEILPGSKNVFDAEGSAMRRPLVFEFHNMCSLINARVRDKKKVFVTGDKGSLALVFAYRGLPHVMTDLNGILTLRYY